MSKKGTALATGAAIAAGPSGLRRLLGGCLVVVLILGLGFAALLAFAAWSARQDSGEGAALPCPPESVAVAWSPQDIPAEVREAVEDALHGAGRETTAGGWAQGQSRDLVIIWTPGVEDRLSTGSSPTKLTLGEVPTAAEVEALLGDRLDSCAPEPTEEPTEAQEPAQEAESDDESNPVGISWPWQRGWSPVAGIGLAATLWWVAGPNLARGTWRALWPVRLGWRKAQRWAYRRRLRRGEEPAVWPARIEPGQRWHEDPKVMHDRRTARQQIAETEPERRVALRERIREERLSGTGIGPASMWQVLYRVPKPEGAPEKEEVSR